MVVSTRVIGGGGKPVEPLSDRRVCAGAPLLAGLGAEKKAQPDHERKNVARYIKPLFTHKHASHWKGSRHHTLEA